LSHIKTNGIATSQRIFCKVAVGLINAFMGDERMADIHEYLEQLEKKVLLLQKKLGR